MANGKSAQGKKREFLAGYLPYLLNRLTREMLRGVDKQFQDRGLTVSKWRILAVLSDRGSCRFGELARLTSIEPATLSRFVGALVRDGLIRRRRSSSDARAVTIGLTEKGEVSFTGTLPWALDVENTLVREIDPENVLRLKQMLEQMYANIHEEFGESEDQYEPAAENLRALDR
jgi:DNA-binding MarR family transcriptional regulator